MMRGALKEDDYYRGQAVEVRNTHQGREKWRPAVVLQRTGRGCDVRYRDNQDGRTHHVLYSDIRALGPARREAPQIGTRVLSAEDIERLNAQLEADAKAKAEETANTQAPPQTLVLLKRPEQPASPEPMTEVPDATPTKRRQRKPKLHQPTPLSDYLRQARGAKALKQADVAQVADISRLSDIELGDVIPTDNELQNLALALDLDLAHLLKLREAPPLARTHEAPPAAEQNTSMELEPLLKELAQMRYRLNQLTEENAGLRAARREPVPVSHDVAQLREENEVLRAAVVFYCGMMQ